MIPIMLFHLLIISPHLSGLIYDEYQEVYDDSQIGSTDSGYEDSDLGSSYIPDIDFDDSESGQVPSVGSSSEELGQFGTDDKSVSDMLDELLKELGNTGLGLSTDEEGLLNDNTLVFGESIQPITSVDLPALVADGIDLYANYNTYYGTIAQSYLEYARGYLPKLGRKEHYVLARTGQYDYIFAFGESLSNSGYYFSGSNITVIHWNTYNNGSFTTGTEGSFSLSCGSNMVYSDLGKVYPSLADTTAMTSRQILYLLTIAGLICTISFMYNVRSVRKLKKIENV